VVVSGIGKSGHVARKIASTLASTGTPAFFLHPAEASHGDLGMVTRDDVFIALSNSGESAELLAIIPLLKRQGAKLVALTGNPQSTLAREADIHVYAGAEQEACPLNLAPTASTTAALALGDALAVALMQTKGFTRDDFAASHPGGALGRKLLTHVRDVMRTGENAPRIGHGASLMEGVVEMSRGRMGITAILDDGGRGHESNAPRRCDDAQPPHHRSRQAGGGSGGNHGTLQGEPAAGRRRAAETARRAQYA
jgi:arabinose-5-phosphate isomerase